VEDRQLRSEDGMRIAIVGCGYVADYYMKTLTNHPDLELVGVTDRDAARLQKFSKFHHAPTFPSVASVLDDPRVELVLNLTNPKSHYAITKALLEAGKHVYSEKPLSLRFAEAEELVALAEARGLELGGAPCSLLGEAAQTVWKALREERIGKVRVVYAELDDGPVHLMGSEKWRSDSGNPWPRKDEFEVGCTLEHAGYYVAWLVGFFGPAKTVTSFAAVTIPDKGTPVEVETPDLTVACLEFRSGVVARITCGIFAPHDHRLRIVGDAGVLSVQDCWDYGSKVLLSKRTKLGIKAEKHPRAARLVGLGPKQERLVRPASFVWKTKGANRMDFARGPAEMAAAIAERRPSRMSARYALHVNEIALAMQYPREMGSPRQLVSTFEPIAPMPWAG
jgi:predicted dehydrogenase